MTTTTDTQVHSPGVRAFLFTWRALGGPDCWQLEHRFAPPRRWRFDLADPETRMAVEIDGATWTAGRHTRGKGFAADCEKANVATARGWRLFRLTTEQASDPLMVELILGAWRSS